MHRIATLNFQPGIENLTDRIRSLSSFPNIDHVNVRLPMRSPVRPEVLARETRKARDQLKSEEGLDLTIWVNNFFEDTGSMFIS